MNPSSLLQGTLHVTIPALDNENFSSRVNAILLFPRSHILDIGENLRCFWLISLNKRGKGRVSHFHHRFCRSFLVLFFVQIVPRILLLTQSWLIFIVFIFGQDLCSGSFFYSLGLQFSIFSFFFLGLFFICYLLHHFFLPCANLFRS
jgi:hypothetical protein